MEKKKECLGLFIIGILLLASTGCIDSSSTFTENKETTTVTDMTGRQVEIPAQVDEIVALEAGALRLVSYLNATDRIAGVENIEKEEKHLKGRPYIYANPQLSELPSVGPKHGGDPELIAAQDPDVIFWTYATKGDAQDLQEKTGIPVIALKYGDLGANPQKIYEGLELMGKVLDEKQRARGVINYFKDTKKDLQKRTKDIPEEQKPLAYVGGVCYKGSHGIVGTEPKYAPFQFVNAKNPAEGLGNEHVMVSKEKLLQWNPEVIFVDEGSYSMVAQDLKEEKYQNLKAVKNNEIHGILPQSYYTHNFATVLADSYFIGKTLYPEKFEDIKPEEKADEIYEFLVGKPVYEKMKQDFGGFKKIQPPN